MLAVFISALKWYEARRTKIIYGVKFSTKVWTVPKTAVIRKLLRKIIILPFWARENLIYNIGTE